MKSHKLLLLLPLLPFAAVLLVGQPTEATTRATPVATSVEKTPKPEAEKKFSAADEYVGKVTKVHDGDTIWIATADKRLKVRLDRIDAPETNRPFGAKSTAYLRSLIGGRQVRVEYTKSDKYGRVLGIVFLENQDINLKMVTDGYAWHYSHFDNTPAYAAAEAEARAAKKGLWATPNPINPYLWRKGGGRGIVSDVRPCQSDR